MSLITGQVHVLWGLPLKNEHKIMDKNLGLRLWEGQRVTTRSSSCFLVNLAPGRHLGGVLTRAGENGGTFSLPKRERVTFQLL